ncbi:Copia protein [Durusdinium trenchii]|uniref:Copia protein n=1 Tax=Durusdinium trenchii TaxID=1381693 RepID=A0ABP0K0I7_9DINO
MSNGAASESAVWKDRDPPPAFNGDVDLYKQFERDLKLWRHDTDVPEEEGIKLADEESLEGGSDSSGDYVYVGEDVLNHVYEEAEIQEALAAYQQVRKAIQEQKTGRGYYAPGSSSSGKGFGKSIGKNKTSFKFTSKGTKVHVDLLKLRTKCARCGQVGHWARFFEIEEEVPQDRDYHVTLGQCFKKVTPSEFTGLTTGSHVGIVDTEAQGGLIGRPALQRLQDSLKEHQLQVRWSNKQAQARGIGGEAKVAGVVEIPVGVAGVNSLIEARVVEDEVPFLLSIKFLKQVKGSSTEDRGDVQSRANTIGWGWKSDSEGGMVSEVPCEVVGGSSDHEPDPVQESRDHSQRKDLPDASRQEHHAVDDAAKRHASHSTQECTIGARLPDSNAVPNIPDVLNGIENSSHAIVASHELIGESTKQPHRHTSEASTNGDEVPTRRAMCDYFEWDPVETRRMQEALMKKGEEEKAEQFESALKKEKEEAIQKTMEVAQERHQALMLDQHIQREREKEIMQNQLLWMTALVGEERLEQALQDPAMQQEAAMRAMTCRQTLQQQASHQTMGAQPSGAQTEGTMESSESGVPPEKMHRWLQGNAIRVCLLENSSQRNLWARLQLEDEEVAEHEKRVLQGYWSESEDRKSWRYYSGILPETAHDLKTTGLFANGAWEEDHYEPGQDRALSKASKKAIVKNMKALTVAEVFSPPRVAVVAEELGHRSGGPYDLQTGYDLSSSTDRMKCMKELRQADPDVLIICPPCSPFSLLQELNRGRTAESAWKLRLAEGKQHLAYGMKLYEWQVRRGKWAIFEHPATSRAWHEEVVQRVLRLPGVQRVRANQCEYGLAVKGLPNQKPTDFMVNGRHLAEALSKRRQGNHEHQALIGGIAKFAQKYPKGLCRAMIQGAIKDVKGQRTYAVEQEEAPREDEVEKALDDHYERLEADQFRHQECLRRPEEEKAHEEEEESGSQQLSKEEKKLVQKLRNNLGHPQAMDFCRALRMARARSAVWKFVKDEFRCEACEQNPRPRSARPAMLPKNFEPARTVGIDVVYFPGLDVRSVKPVLNMVDWATGYQMLEPLQPMQSEHVWNTFHSTWVRVFRMPECIVVDQGREFGKDFTEKVNEMGAVMKVIGARAPWQQGRTERHGGLAKEIFVKLREDALPTSEHEWKQCVHVLEAAKNRMHNRLQSSSTTAGTQHPAARKPGVR